MPKPNSTGENIYEWVCQIVSLGYFLTPVIELLRLSRGNLKVNHFPLALLITIMINCLFWVIFCFVDGNSWISMLFSNGVGLFVNLCLLFFYLFLLLNDGLKQRQTDYNILSEKQKKKQWNPTVSFYVQFIGYGLFMINVLVEISYLMYRYIIKDHIDTDRKEVLDQIGLFAMILNVLMYASPLTNIKKVSAEHSEKNIPMITNICGLVSCIMWIIYGLVITGQKSSDKKRTIYSNTVSGVTILLQIIFWVVLRSKNKKKGIKVDSTDQIFEQEGP